MTHPSFLKALNLQLFPTKGGRETFSVATTLTSRSSEKRGGFQNHCTSAPSASCNLLAGAALAKDLGGEKADSGRQNNNCFTCVGLQ